MCCLSLVVPSKDFFTVWRRREREASFEKRAGLVNVTDSPSA